MREDGDVLVWASEVDVDGRREKGRPKWTCKKADNENVNVGLSRKMKFADHS